MADYGITIDGIKRNEAMINSGQPVKIEFRDDSWNWIMVEAMVSFEPIEGGMQVDVLPGSGPLRELGKPVYVKVLRELDAEDAITKIKDVTSLTQDE